MLTEAAVSSQVLNEEDAELLKEIYTRLEIFEQENRPFHDDAKESREIMRLRDPKQDIPGSKEQVLQLSTLKSTINNCVADQMQNMPEPKLIPEVPEDEALAFQLQDAVHYLLYTVNDYEHLHFRRTLDFYETGTAVTQIAWDPDMSFGKGDIAVLRWPIEAFLWDPQAENIQDARAVMKVSWHPKSWYKQHYPETADYISTEDGSHNDVGLSEEQKNRNSADEGRAMLIEYWYRLYKNNKYTINVAYAAGGALLGRQENVYKHGMYPFVLDVHSTVEGSAAGEGLVKELVPMMRYINRYAHYIDTNLRMSSKGRILMRKGSGINPRQLADWSQDIVEGERVVQGEDWNWMQHVPFNGMISNQLLQFQSDMKQDSGANQFTRGETTGGVISGKAIGYLQEAGGKITSMRTATLNDGFKAIVEQVLWLMAQFYNKERLLNINGETVEVSSKKFFGDSDVPPYLVKVEVEKRNPVQIQAQNEMFLQAYTMAAQAQQYFPLSALFRIMNIEGKDRLLPIIEANEEKQDMMMQLQQQNEEMAAQMEQLQAENQNLRNATSQMADTLQNIGGGMMNAPGETAASPEETITPEGMANATRDMISQIPDE
jgi:hypothetical protein